MIVVDTNVVTYLVLKMPESATAVAVRGKDSLWSAPLLWRSELRNVLITLVRRSVIGVTDAIGAVERANHLVRSQAVSTGRVLKLADLSGCTAYDCEFVSVAERLQVPLVTNDKQVLAAFPSIATSMLDFLAL